MEVLIPIVIGGIILWLYMKGNKRINETAPYCDRCGKKTKKVGSAYRTQYGVLYIFRCPSCGAEKTRY